MSDINPIPLYPPQGENLSSILHQQFEFYQKFANGIITDLESKGAEPDATIRTKNALMGKLSQLTKI